MAHSQADARLSDRLRALPSLQWWMWVKVVGAAGLVWLGALLLLGLRPHPLMLAVVLHLATDFTFQSAETDRHKSERGRHLMVHALVAGALPLAIAGLVEGDPVAVLAWSAAGAVSHYAVDWTHKFGLRQKALAVVLDQACHVITVAVLVCTV